MKVEHEKKLDRNEMGMVRSVCGCALKERKNYYLLSLPLVAIRQTLFTYLWTY